MALLRLLILCWILACGSFIARSQSVSELNSLLDSTLYSQIHIKEYRHHLSLPDSTQQKVVRVLEGYIPPHIQQRVSILDSSALKRIENYALRLCASDTLCFRKTKDSLTADYIQHNMELLKEEPFQETFILAVGSWGIKTAEKILTSKENNSLFPQFATLLALSKLRDNILSDSLKSLLEVVDNPDLSPIDREEYICTLYNRLYLAGIYMKDKTLLMRLVDLLDIKGQVWMLDGLYPAERSVASLLYTSSLVDNIQNKEGQREWKTLVWDYSREISTSRNNPRKLRKVLSVKNKLHVEVTLKGLIDKYITFD